MTSLVIQNMKNIHKTLFTSLLALFSFLCTRHNYCFVFTVTNWLSLLRLPPRGLKSENHNWRKILVCSQVSKDTVKSSSHTEKRESVPYGFILVFWHLQIFLLWSRWFAWHILGFPWEFSFYLFLVCLPQKLSHGHFCLAPGSTVLEGGITDRHVFLGDQRGVFGWLAVLRYSLLLLLVPRAVHFFLQCREPLQTERGGTALQVSPGYGKPFPCSVCIYPWAQHVTWNSWTPWGGGDLASRNSQRNAALPLLWPDSESNRQNIIYPEIYLK